MKFKNKNLACTYVDQIETISLEQNTAGDMVFYTVLHEMDAGGPKEVILTCNYTEFDEAYQIYSDLVKTLTKRIAEPDKQTMNIGDLIRAELEKYE